MADLDAELLALAGGDSSGEESVASPRRGKSSSPVYEKEDSPPARKPASRNVKRGRKSKDYSDDEDDDMSASDASESASMSQSDSEAEFEADDKPMFAYERLYHSAQDKADIEKKPEIEREAILAERNEAIEKHEQNAQLRRMLNARAKEESKLSAKRKRKASTDLEDTRKSSRQRKTDSGSSKIAAYKKQREEAAARKEAQKSGAPAPRRSRMDEYSDADADAESDDDYGYNDYAKKRQKSISPPRDDPPAELQDIQRVRIGRENFAQVCYTPGFEETMRGCYARVCLGPGRIPGQNEYRLCSIKGFQEGRPYAIEGPNRKQVLVNRYIIAQHGKAEKPWSFLECSNSRFTDDEWRRWRTVMANEGERMPTKGQINAKLSQINRLINHRFTDSEISTKLKQQNDLLDIVNRASDKKAIKDKIRDAEDRGDDEAIRDLEDQLMNLVPLKLALGTSLNNHANAHTNKSTEHDRLAQLNSHNAKLAAENLQKAAVLKKRQYKKTQPSSQEKDKLTVPGSQTKNLDDDLFGSASDISRAATPLNGDSRAGTPARSAMANGISRTGTPLSSKNDKRGLPVIAKGKRDDEVMANLDLGIEIDI